MTNNGVAVQVLFVFKHNDAQFHLLDGVQNSKNADDTKEKLKNAEKYITQNYFIYLSCQPHL